MYNKKPKEIKKSLLNQDDSICVVGLGFIGLPLSVAFASKKIQVYGYDTDKKIVSLIRNGKSHIYEPGIQELILETTRKDLLHASNDPKIISNSKFIIITVGTPVDKFYAPNLEHVRSACKAVGKKMKKNSIITLKSTVPPLTTENIVIPLLKDFSGMRCGKDFGVAFCPERTVEGQAMKEFKTLPKIVGGCDKKTTDIVGEVFSLLGGSIIKVSSPRVAEMVKLMDNAYRDVNIALANEFAKSCNALGIDVIESIESANKDYLRNNILIPGAGVGGSCLTKDPFILAITAERYGETLPLIKCARMVNSEMPNRMIALIHDVLRGNNKTVSESKITILGLSFKANTNDLRNTPAKVVIDSLRNEGGKLLGYDPFVFKKEVKQVIGKINLGDNLYDSCQNSDCIVIMTDHREFYDIDLVKLKSLMNTACIVDGRHVIDPLSAIKLGFTYEGIGRPSKYFKDLIKVIQ